VAGATGAPGSQGIQGVQGPQGAGVNIVVVAGPALSDFQAACTTAAAAKKHVYMPSGTYSWAHSAGNHTTATWDGMIVFGDGVRRTIVNCTGDGTDYQVFNWGVNTSFQIRDVAFHGDFVQHGLDGSGLPVGPFVFFMLQNTPGNTFTTEMDGLLERVAVDNFYAGFSAQSGAVNACPTFHLRASYCTLTGGANPIEIYSDPAWMGKRLSVDHCVLGDTDPTVGSHAIYTHHTVRQKITNNVFRNIRSGGKYGIQKFGTSNTGCDDDIITGNTFESTIMGGGIITNGQSLTIIEGNTFRCAYGIGARGPIIAIGNHFAPIMASAWAISTAYKTGNLRSNGGHLYECIRGGTSAGSGGPTTTASDITDGTVHWKYINDSTSNTGQGIITTTSTQADCQWVIQGNTWDLHGVANSSYNACVIVDQPRVKISLKNNKVFAQNHLTASGSALEALNAGSFLKMQDGSSGSTAHVVENEINFLTTSGTVNYLASLFGSCGAAYLRNNTFVGRSASDRGVVRTDAKTSSDLIVLEGNDITTTAGVVIWTDAGTPANTIKGRNNKFHGVTSTFVAAQKMQGHYDVGPDIASASTIAWDQDYGWANVTGTTTIDTMNITGVAQIGYDGLVAGMTAPSGWATSTSGNFAAIYTVAAGGTLIVRYNGATSKWVKIGGA
jgi:hypothetical protein